MNHHNSLTVLDSMRHCWRGLHLIAKRTKTCHLCRAQALLKRERRMLALEASIWEMKRAVFQ